MTSTEIVDFVFVAVNVFQEFLADLDTSAKESEVAGNDTTTFSPTVVMNELLFGQGWEQTQIPWQY
jgi:hypothetical protein